MYLKCSECGEGGCHVEDDQGQGVVPYWKREKMSWCGCKGKREESGVPTERKSAARVEKAAQPREAKAQQSGARSGELESTEKEGGSQENLQNVERSVVEYRNRKDRHA